ncbi:tyrosine-protein phosphatase non-receptor type 6-like isoform X2 [Lissotriton helveticus]
MERWFHPNISGLEAEALLKSRGVHGSYLVRPSQKTQGDFTLSVRVDNTVSHTRIQNTGDYYDLYGGEKFATLAELLEFYTKEYGNLQEKDGTLIELKYPVNCSYPTSERWYHGPLSGAKAEKLLVLKGEPWTFLVRDSLSKPGDFVISVLTDEMKDSKKKVTHIKILCKNGKYTLGGREKFDSLADLIEHYKKTHILEVSGSLVYIKQPYFATRFHASDLESRMKVLDKKSEVADSANSGFLEEFDALQKQEAKQLRDRSEGQRPENKSKNRYKNILPFDETRVILESGDPKVPGSDYINANYVKNRLVSPDEYAKTFIACQGCLADTVNDFWQMVWQENSRLIVMITREVEKGRNKYLPYWPRLNSTKEFGPYLVENVKEHTTIDCKTRLLRLSLLYDANEVRDIWHYQFLSWPAHGMPGEPGGVLSFLDEINRVQEREPNAGPIIVHGSAGIGRTGTIIVIDMLMDMINTTGLNCDIDIQKTIQMVREQRSGMVQTEAQYRFIYMAIRQFIDTEKQKFEAMQTTPESQYGNIQRIQGAKNTHTKATRKSSKQKHDEAPIYENLHATWGKQDEESKEQKSTEQEKQ